MVIGPIVNLILTVFYLLLGYITFKELSNRHVEESTLQRILLKWMIAAVFFSSFWVIEYFFYFLPTSFAKLPLGLYILLPQFYGEYKIFNLFSDLFEFLEYYFRNIRNSVSSGIFNFTFGICMSSFTIIKKFIPTDKLKESQNELRKLDKEMNDELRLRKLIKQQMSGTGSGYQTPGGPNDRRERRDTTIINPDLAKAGTGMHYKPPSAGNIYTPVGLYTKPPLINNFTKSIAESDEFSSDKNQNESKTAVKSNRHSRKSSKEQFDLPKAKGSSSSYVDKSLLNRQSSQKESSTKKPKTE